MPRYKVSFIFRQSAQGWTESWYLDAETITLALDVMQKLAPHRSRLLGLGTHIQAVRAAEVGKPRAANLRMLSTPLETSSEKSDYPSASIVVRLVGLDDRQRRVMTLRGCPDIPVKEDTDQKRIKVDNKLQKILDTFITEANNVGIKFRTPDRSDPINSGQSIQSFTSLADRVVITSVDLNALTTDRIRIKKVRGLSKTEASRINRTHKILSKTGDTYRIDLPSLTLPKLGDAYAGKAYRITPTYDGLRSAKIIRVGKRATGRAFFVPRGRRKKRR